MSPGLFFLMSNISAKLSNDYEKKKLLDHLVSTISGKLSVDRRIRK